jgi:hypothetical protein
MSDKINLYNEACSIASELVTNYAGSLHIDEHTTLDSLIDEAFEHDWIYEYSVYNYELLGVLRDYFNDLMYYFATRGWDGLTPDNIMFINGGILDLIRSTYGSDLVSGLVAAHASSRSVSGM